MKRQESKEDYLESLLVLRERLGDVRSIDIVNHLGFTKPSVSVAMKNLRQIGYVTMDGEGHLALTEAGEQIARRVLERHTILTAALVAIGVAEEIAREDACRIEHDISEETFQKIKERVEKAKTAR